MNQQNKPEKNYFELFQLPPQFALDVGLLEQAYRQVQSQVHPDRFVTASDAEKRVAMQWATRANGAYQTLRSPLKRAAYLCELNGVNLEIESNTTMPAAFLMQQMEWREQLQEALQAARATGKSESLLALENELKTMQQQFQQMLAQQLDQQADYVAAAQSVRQWMFVDKFAAEIDAAYAALEN